MRSLLRALAAGALLATSACAGPAAPAPTPSPKAQLVLALAPNRSAPAQVAAAERLAAELAAAIKTPVVVRPEPSAAALLADAATGAVDIGWTDALTYVALRQRVGPGVRPVLRAASCYPTYTPSPPAPGCRPQPGTPAILVCNSSVDVPELRAGDDWGALKGKRFAFQDAASLTGYVWPRYYLAQGRIDPDHDLLKGPPAPTDVAVSLAVYNGIADCGAISGDGRLAARRFAPDLFDRTKVVFVAPSSVPGDVVLLASSLNADQARRLREGLARLGTAPAAAGPISDLAGAGAGALLPAGDRDFDMLRSAVAAVNPRLVEGALPAPSPSRRPSATPVKR